MAADLRARVHADVDNGIDHGVARYLGDLAPAADAVAANLSETRNAMAMDLGRETARLNAEKTRLEALLAEIPDGVMFCTGNHTIALYNGRCREILHDDAALGLGRPVAGLLRMGPIGARFDQPILDTVLCSAILSGQSAEHTLDALCARLHIEIPAEARHTAIGDAIATSEAFRQMIPMLEAAELPYLEASIKAFDRHRRLIEHLN